MIEGRIKTDSNIMIGMFGPEWREERTENEELTNKWGVRIATERAPFMVNASTFGRALEIYCSYFKCALEPFSGELPQGWCGHGIEGSYFQYTPQHGEESVLDIHIRRGEDILCPKQDMSYPMKTDDIITVGVFRIC